MENNFEVNGSNLTKYLNTIYPLNLTLTHSLKILLGNSILVFAFLRIFKPFGLGVFHGHLLWHIISGFGLICFFVLGFDLVLIPKIVPALFRKKDWKVYKQILWLLWQICTVAVANLIYVHHFGGAVELTFKSLLHALVITLAFALIPISFGLASFQNHLSREYLRQYQSHLLHSMGNGARPDQVVVLKGENKRDELRFLLDDLLYLTSADNYVEIYCKNGSKTRKWLLRASLRSVEESLKDYPTVFRCHRAFIVNLRNVQSVNGNSVGYKIVLQHVEKNIPVSRRYAKKLKERMRSNC